MRKLALLALVLATCGDSTPPGFSTGPAATSAAASTSTSGSSTGGDTSTGPADDSAGDTSAGSSTGILRDVGAPPVDQGTPAPVGCQGKVDILFLISRFGSMKEEQTQLLASAAGFVKTIESKLAGFDVHLMAANPDGDWPGWVCEQGCNDDPQNCAEYGYKCNDYAWLVEECDEILGAGITFNAGGHAANRRCELHGGNRYILNGQPDLEDAIECIAHGGMSGGDPPMGDALIAALDPDINGADGCNAGFLRKDALLVIVIINDTEDVKSKSWPYQQYNAVVAAKGGDPNAIVVLGVIAQPQKGPEVPGCIYDTLGDKYKVRQLLKKFNHHVEGDTCAPSYAPYFDQTVELIEKVCADFVPIPG